jgi:hypothetical protein
VQTEGGREGWRRKEREREREGEGETESETEGKASRGSRAVARHKRYER